MKEGEISVLDKALRGKYLCILLKRRYTIFLSARQSVTLWIFYLISWLLLKKANWNRKFSTRLQIWHLFCRKIYYFHFFSKIAMHPNYEFTPQADRYDVALLKLDRPATLMPHVSPICLPNSVFPVGPDRQSIVAGWGAMQSDSKRRPKVLQAVDVMTIENNECERWHMRSGIRLKKNLTLSLYQFYWM